MQLREQREIAKADKNFEALLNNSLPQIYVDLGIDHWSPTSLNKPVGIDLILKLIFTQEERRLFYVGPKAHFGNYPGNNHPMHVADQIWFGQSEVLNLAVHEKYNWDQMMESVQQDINAQDLSYNKIDKHQHEHHKKLMPAVLENWHKAYKAISLQGKVICERTVTGDLGSHATGLGRIDYEGDHALIEYKTKPPRRGKMKADGTYGFSTQAIPKDVQIEHARQTAFYWHATGRKLKPFVAYVNEKEWKVFDPNTSDMLTVAAMEDHIEYYKRQAQLRDNLIQASQGDMKKLLGMIDPDFGHNFYWNIGDQFVIKAKQSINNALSKEG